MRLNLATLITAHMQLTLRERGNGHRRGKPSPLQGFRLRRDATITASSRQSQFSALGAGTERLEGILPDYSDNLVNLGVGISS